MSKGVLMVNLGTPEAPTPEAVGTYLIEFLSDPLVVDLPRWLWIPVLRLVIVPLRKKRSAEAYSKVWTDQGSPLLVESQKLAQAVQAKLGDAADVSLAMRYGNPALKPVLQDMRERGVTELVILPMYPQFSRTTTQTVLDGVAQALRELDWFPQIESIPQYFDRPEWVKAVAESVRDFQKIHGQPDKLLFSLHGIPERYAAAGDPYALQCQASASSIALELGLQPDQWHLAFQSRVGREPWLKPYTDFVLKEWGEEGVGTVHVVCPGFAVDCLETLEEIAMENAELFEESGGRELKYIPALNDSERHAELMEKLIEDAIKTIS